MPTSTPPLRGNWYIDTETRHTFRVVAIDEAAETIEIQYFAGEVAEFDLESWQASAFEPIEPPEDWSAPYGGIDADDLGYSDPDNHSKQSNDLSLSDLLDND